MLDQVISTDPSSYKAWLRKGSNYIQIAELDQARAALKQAEVHAISIEERAEITNLYKDLAKKNLKEKQFSEKIFANSPFLYEDKPDFRKVEEFAKNYELEYLESLNAFEWFIYPFVKTLTITLRKVGCCLRNDEKKVK